MAFLLLVNTVGDAATSLDTASSGTTASGYDINDVISGPRSAFWRTQASTGAIRAAYHLAADVIATHMVVARADWLVTQGTMRVRPYSKNSGGTWSAISGVDFNPLTSANLMGPTAQDLAFAIGPTVYRGYAIEADTIGGTAEAMQISKFYPSIAFDFGIDPIMNPAPTWQPLPAAAGLNLAIPQRASTPLEVERRITIMWDKVTTAKAEAFKNLAQLLRWPMFLYDVDGNIFNWKLEHVIVENYQEEFLTNAFRRIQITFLRLKHYE